MSGERAPETSQTINDHNRSPSSLPRKPIGSNLNKKGNSYASLEGMAGAYRKPQKQRLTLRRRSRRTETNLAISLPGRGRLATFLIQPRTLKVRDRVNERWICLTGEFEVGFLLQR
jgi:hypothetical protein